MHSADHSLSGDDTINVVKATVPQEATVTASGASAWVKRHPLLAFFVLAFAVTWVIVFLALLVFIVLVLLILVFTKGRLSYKSNDSS